MPDAGLGLHTCPKKIKKSEKIRSRVLTSSFLKIGAALISADGTLIGRGHNQRVQLGSAIHHGETSALYNSGRLPASAYKGSTMYTTLSPCDMCKDTYFLTNLPLSLLPPRTSSRELVTNFSFLPYSKADKTCPARHWSMPPLRN